MPTVIDLFAGAGGFGLGFELAGFTMSLALEIDTWACDTLRYNHPTAAVIQADIRDFTTSPAIVATCPAPPDIIIGGPPCQGFSIAGPARKDPADPGNSLFISFADWVRQLQPEAFVMENVTGLLSRRNAEGEKVTDIIGRIFREELGCFVEIWRLNAAEYGVPQTRERIFIVGHHGGQAIGEPPPTHSLKMNNVQLMLLHEQALQPSVTLWDAISDLPELRAGEGAEEQPYASGPSTAFQLYKPSHTVAASFYANFIHPYQHRNLTAREGARLQSFPDEYRIMGGKLLYRIDSYSEKSDSMKSIYANTTKSAMLCLLY